MFERFFDPISLCFYSLIAVTGVYCISKSLSIENKSSCNSLCKFGIFNRYLLIVYITWLSVSVFRYIDENIGGTDAPTYIEYFDTCLNYHTNLYGYRTEPLFRFFTKLCKILLHDYHLYFIIIYTVIIVGIVRFFRAYYIPKMSCIPMIISFYFLVYSFNVVRNGFSIGILLISFSCLQEGKYKCSVILALISALMHTASAIYAPFVIGYVVLSLLFQYNTKKIKNYQCDKLFELNYRKIFIFSFGIMLLVEFLSKWVVFEIQFGQLKYILYNLGLGQPFNVYANSAYGDDFWGDLFGLRVSRPQWILMVLVFILHNPMMAFVRKQGNNAVKSYTIVLAMLIYNMIIFPAVYYFHIWRDPEYFLLGRLVVWGVIIGMIIDKVSGNSKVIVRVLFFLISISFFSIKIYKAYDMAHLTPYYIEPIGYFFKTLL